MRLVLFRDLCGLRSGLDEIIVEAIDHTFDVGRFKNRVGSRRMRDRCCSYVVARDREAR